jgi:hypothetical protein
MGAWFGLCVLGLIAVTIARVRDEKPPAVTVAAFLLNLILASLLLGNALKWVFNYW